MTRALPAVERTPQGFAVRGARYVPFQPPHADQQALRALLRDEIAQVSVGAGELLHARFAGELPPGTDVENVLLYNVGGFGGALRAGVRFERAPSPPNGVAYVYEAAPVEAGFAHWTLGRTLALVPPLAVRSVDATRVWWTLHPEVAAKPEDGPFAVRLSVRGPASTLSPDRVKAIVDGVVCALQAQGDAVLATQAAPLVAEALGVEAAVVVARLTDARRAVLGVVPDLRRMRSWNPSDHRCVAGEVLFERAPAWQLVGDVVAVAPASSA